MNNEFELKQLKLTFHHFSSGELNKGMPLATSVELKNEYNFEKKRGVLGKSSISHICEFRRKS